MNPDRRELIHKADHLWHEVISMIFFGRCVMCGLPGSDPHHWMFGRSILAFRWHLMNGVFMCRGCHGAVELDNGKRLGNILKKNYKSQWKWGEEVRIGKPEPFTTDDIVATILSLENSQGVMCGRRNYD